MKPIDIDLRLLEIFCCVYEKGSISKSSDCLHLSQSTMCYMSLCAVANPAAGIAGYRLTSDEVINLMKQKEEEIGRVIIEFVKRLPEERNCGCDKILDGAEV